MREKLVVGIVTAALLLGGFWAYASAGGGDTYTLTAEIEQAPNLFSGGRVMVRGVEVGKITDVEPHPGAVHVTLEIREDVKIPADATLSVIPVTVISDRYVQFFPAYDGGPVMEPGTHIEVARTTIPAELDDVLTQLQGLLEALEPKDENRRGSLARLIDSLDKVFANRSEELAGVLDNGATVLENLADSEADLTGLIQNLDRAFFALANRASEIGIVNERFQLVAQALLADQSNLEGTIENIAFLSDETADLLDSSGEQLGSSFRRLGKVLRIVLKHQGDLKRGIQWSNVIAQTLGETGPNGKGLYAYTGRQAPPGTEGAAYNYRLDSRDTVSCERLQVVANSVLAVTPAANVDDIVETALSFIPDFYDDDLEYLIRLLIINCVEFPNSSSLDTAAAETVRAIADEVGPEAFAQFLGRWLTAGYEPEGSP